MKLPGQRARLLILGLYLALLFLASRIALGTWLPPTTEKGLWFYSGLAALLLGNLLVTPFYTKPADAISYAVAGIVGLLAVNAWHSPQQTRFDVFLWSASLVYVVLVLVAGTLSIAFRDSSHRLLQKTSASLYHFSYEVGTPRSVFSVIFLYALVTFHRDNPREYIAIGLAWALLVALKPLEVLGELFRRWRELWTSSRAGEQFGEVVGQQLPGITLIRHDANTRVSLGDTLVVTAGDGLPNLAMALDHVGFAEGRWLRAIQLDTPEGHRNLLTASAALNPLGCTILRGGLEQIGVQALPDPAFQNRDRLVGLVASNTDVSRLLFEIVRTDLDIQEGRLLEVQIGTAPVLFQIINGLTKEEILEQKNTRGFVLGEAKKIGLWNPRHGRFDVVKWVPRPNAPVFLLDTRQAEPNREAVGHLPGTDYPVSIDVDLLVTHNTAILGILGAGKSFLSLELVERMISSGIKVICLDLTNQYAQELDGYYFGEANEQEAQQLQQIGSAGRNNFQQITEAGGSVNNFKEGLKQILARFLDHGTQEHLRIYNPAHFEVWRQDGKLFRQGERPPMATLTPTEITRLFAEAALEVLQGHGMTDQARCCIVFEEAHSLIPEWTAIASEGDRAATNGTAKAMLQGRKYGLGCQVITQRTANVTKSILNQCNTVFALRVFDATGMEFLKNYIGEDYSSVLSTLEDRHAVVFGRASSCRDPLLIRLNDRDDFVRVFRNN